MSETATAATTSAATRVEKEQGSDHVILMEYIDTSTKKVALLLGQTSHSTNYSNTLVESSDFKGLSVSQDDDVQWTRMEDGKRQVATSVSVGMAKKNEDRATQKEILKRITTKSNTDTTIYDGVIYPNATDATKIMFDGEKRVMKIESYNIDYPDGADISGTIEFKGAGVKPITIEGIEVSQLPTYDPDSTSGGSSNSDE